MKALKISGEVLVHFITAIVILFVLLIVFRVDILHAHPSANSCHKHGSVVHCK